VDLDQLNGRPNATTAAYTKFLLRLAEGPQVRSGVKRVHRPPACNSSVLSD
jgi:hypothetical protein